MGEVKKVTQVTLHLVLQLRLLCCCFQPACLPLLLIVNIMCMFLLFAAVSGLGLFPPKIQKQADKPWLFDLAGWSSHFRWSAKWRGCSITSSSDGAHRNACPAPATSWENAALWEQSMSAAERKLLLTFFAPLKETQTNKSSSNKAAARLAVLRQTLTVSVSVYWCPGSQHHNK